MKLFFWTLLSLLLLPFAHPISAQDTSEKTPMLYYFSREDQAFVFERADGSERRLVGVGVMPRSYAIYNLANPNKVDFSVSGEWFSWVGTYIRLNGARTTGAFYSGFIMNLETNQSVPLPAHLKNAQRLTWSPCQDLILIEYHYQQPFANDYRTVKNIGVFDPATATLLVDLRGIIANEVNWSANGDYLVLKNYTTLTLIDLSGKPSVILTEQILRERFWTPDKTYFPTSLLWLDRENRLISISAIGATHVIDAPSSLIENMGFYNLERSRTGRYALLLNPSDSLNMASYLFDSVTQTLTVLADYSSVQLFWSPDDHYALYYALDATLFDGFHLLDLQTHRSTTISVDSLDNYDVEWLENSLMVYSRWDAKTSVIYLIDTTTGQLQTKRTDISQTISPAPDGVHFLDIAPCGTPNSTLCLRNWSNENQKAFDIFASMSLTYVGNVYWGDDGWFIAYTGYPGYSLLIVGNADTARILSEQRGVAYWVPNSAN